MSETLSLRDRTAIVGIDQTEFSKHLEPNEKALACQVILGALDDAGIDASEVDGFASYTMENADASEVAKSIGSRGLTHFSQIGYGGGAGPGVVGQLAMAVATGQCKVGVAWRARKRGSGVRPWASGMYAQPTTTAAFTRPYGLCRPADEIAMLMRRYMYEYGATREHLCNIATTVRKMANNNPNALMYEKKMSRDDYMQARWISEPLCLFDNCLETDGALACVVVAADRAKDCRQRPAYIHSFAQGMAEQGHSMTNYWSEGSVARPRLDGRTGPIPGFRLQARRHRLRATLRRVHTARPALARGLRLLQARRGPGLHRKAATSTSAAACRSTPRAVVFRRPTFTASTSCSRESGNSAAPRRTPSPVARAPWSLPANASRPAQ